MTTPPTSASPKRPLSPREERLHEAMRSARRWLEQSLTRQSLLAGLKTLGWLVPLTLLIWVYAEREQSAEVKSQTIPIEVTSRDRNVYVELKSPSDKNVTAQLNGPQAMVAAIQMRISPQGDRPSVQISVDPTLTPGNHELDAASAILSSRVFSQSGVTVSDCKPARLQVLIDKYEEREVEVKPPPSVTNLASEPIFLPAKITVRAPSTFFGAEAPVVYADLSKAGDLSKPGSYAGNVPVYCSSTRLKGESVTFSPTGIVKATFDTRPSDVQDYTIPTVSVWVQKPASKDAVFRVKCDEPTLSNVPVKGPPDQIAMLKQTPPIAVLKVPPGAVPSPELQHAVLEFKLPEGVTVDPTFAAKQFDYTLISLTPE